MPARSGLLYGVVEQLVLARIVFIPAAEPPHRRDPDMAPAGERVEMVRLAVADIEGFEVDDLELRRPGPSYTVDTVGAYRERLGPDADIFFIIGADTVPELASWYRIKTLAGLCRFAAVTRPGHDLERIDTGALGLPTRLVENMARIEIPGVDISATGIRRRLAKDEPIAALVPAAVERFIRKCGLYASRTL